MARNSQGKHPALSPSSRADLEQHRNGVVAVGPSGLVYRIRPPNATRHALAGGLPLKLRQLATQGGSKALARAASTDEDEEFAAGVLSYMDKLVLGTVLEPTLTQADLEPDDTGQANLPSDDYKWLLEIAQLETVYDGEQKRMWGKETFDRWATFRGAHGCDDECDACADVIRASYALATATG